VTGLDDFREFCGELTLDTGRPMELERWQGLALGDFFAGCRESLILLPKKNGKTTLLGALGLFHLLAVPDAAVYIAAASREQASLLYGAAVGFISRSDALREQIVTRTGYRELWVADGPGKLRVLASDVDTADGVLPTLALVDELPPPLGRAIRPAAGRPGAAPGASGDDLHRGRR
jgi:phage terminase large subunit-like protein